MPIRVQGGGYEPWLTLCRQKAAHVSTWISPAAHERIDRVWLEAIIGTPVAEDVPIHLMSWVVKVTRDLGIIPKDLKVDTYTVSTRSDLIEHWHPELKLHVRLFIEMRADGMGSGARDAAIGPRFPAEQGAGAAL